VHEHDVHFFYFLLLLLFLLFQVANNVAQEVYDYFYGEVEILKSLVPSNFLDELKMALILEGVMFYIYIYIPCIHTCIHTYIHIHS
jgi:hypothetical protein